MKRIYDYYNATFPGEIREKFKRKCLVKIGVFEKNKIYKIPNNLKINSNFKEIFNGYKNKKNLKESLEEFYIFNKKINFKEEILENNKNSKKWYLENISKYKDIKVIWEINRLQFLNYLVIKNKKEEAIELLDKWIDKNPFNFGINWNNNLEIAIRTISIINFIFKLKDIELLDKYQRILFLHGIHIYNDISYTEKCIPNNHVIGEATALYCLGHLLDFNEKEKWLSKAKQILEKYIVYFHEDGTYEEASLSYHRFVLQMYIMVFIFSNIGREKFLSKEIEKILEKSLIFFNSIEKTNKEYPNFGDNDEGQYFLVMNKRNFSEFVNSLRKIFNQNLNYYGEIQELESIYNIKFKFENFQSEIKKEFFETGKYYCYKTDKNYIFVHNQKQIHHSHSDGMTLELVLENKNVLIDSGTYNYNINDFKRKYYRGTKSHNTVWIGEDQSLQVGKFRWINKLKQSFNLIKYINSTKVEGKIILGNKEHQRIIKFNDDLKEIEIEDEIINSNNFELNWIFSNETKLERRNENIFIINPINYEIEIVSKNDLNIQICENFYSLRYNEETQGKMIKISSKESRKKIKIFTLIRKKEKL